jgi:hypothetical protein
MSSKFQAPFPIFAEPPAVAVPEARVDAVRRLYLDLMKRSVTGWIYADVEPAFVPPIPTSLGRLLVFGLCKRAGLYPSFGSPARDPRLLPYTPPSNWKKQVVAVLERMGLFLCYWPAPVDAGRRELGEDFPTTAHSMVGLKRLDNVQACVETVLREGVPGDLIETGVWRGGTVIFMRAILAAHAALDRVVWAADSFEGLPAPDLGRHPQEDPTANFHEFSGLAVSLERVQANFARYGLLDDQVRFLKGWFSDTLPGAPIERLAVLRLDGDMYGSTMDALVSLYPKLSTGGFVIVDDYHIDACRRAISDFRATHGIEDPLVAVDNNAVYWRRST